MLARNSTTTRFTRALSQAISPYDNGLDIWAIWQHRHHDITLLGHFSWGMSGSRTCACQFVNGRTTAIEHRERVASGEQVVRHWPAHQSQADKTDAFSHTVLLSSIPATTLRVYVL